MRTAGDSVLVIVTLFLTACASTHPPEESPRPISVSLVAILGDPARYQGKTVSVAGALDVSHGLEHLCLDSGSTNFVVTQNCVAIILLPDLPRESVREHSDTYVVLTGVVAPPPFPSEQRYAATLKDVSRIEALDVRH